MNYDIIDATKLLSEFRSLNNYSAPFKIIGNYRMIDDGVDPEATVRIEAFGNQIYEASNGNGPVDALANVLKKGLTPLFREISDVNLVDYSARIIDSKLGTATTVMVEITFTNGQKLWKVYSSSENINAASFNVLVDGFEFAIVSSSI